MRSNRANSPGLVQPTAHDWRMQLLINPAHPKRLFRADKHGTLTSLPEDDFDVLFRASRPTSKGVDGRYYST
jgi:hypothetical protein